MTQDVYMGRRVVDPAAALALEGAGSGDSAHLNDHTSGSAAGGDGRPDTVPAVVKLSVRDSTDSKRGRNQRIGNVIPA